MTRHAETERPAARRRESKSGCNVT
jgi:hypothetical protein